MLDQTWYFLGWSVVQEEMILCFKHINSDIRSTFSGLGPVRIWKLLQSRLKCPHGEYISPHTQCEPLSFNFVPVVNPHTEPGFLLLSSLKSLCPRLANPSWGFSSQGSFSQPPSRLLMSFLYCGAPNWMQHLNVV